MEIYLIRHTTPAIEKGICYGQSDILLAESFHEELKTLQKRLPEKFDAIYSSPLSRCYKLAEQLSCESPVISDARLLELNFGDWELKSWNEINREELNNWMQDFVNVRVPGGENFISLHKRVNCFIDDLREHKYKKIAIVTHAGVIRSFVAGISKIPLSNIFKIPVDYSSVTQINIHNSQNISDIKIHKNEREKSPVLLERR